MNYDPYEVLGVSPEDSMYSIEKVYKDYVMLLHPDKHGTYESKQLKMSREDKIAYYKAIKEAYNHISKLRKDSKYPDYPVSYNVDGGAKINMRQEFTEEDRSHFNPSKFNSVFEKNLENTRKQGMDDPYNRGYGNKFDIGKKFNESGAIKPQQYSDDIEISKPSSFQIPEMKDGSLVEYVPDSTIFSDTTSGFQELGITNISNFSMTTSGKGSIGGVDLMSVYGQNFENWEDTVRRDPNLYSKYNDNTNIASKAARLEDTRRGIYDDPKDKKMLSMESKRNMALDIKEKSRIVNKHRRDEFYNNLNKGLLN